MIIKENSSMISFIIFVIIATIILLYHTYQIWFLPEKYIATLKSGIRDWWPFADFFKRWFASKLFLWLGRIAYSMMLLILIFLLSITLLGNMGLFP